MGKARSWRRSLGSSAGNISKCSELFLKPLQYESFIYESAYLFTKICIPQRCGGAVYVEGRENGFAVAAQEPWIQHGSVRDNILFGKEYRSRLYQAVLEACALSEDLSVSSSLSVH